MRWAQAATAADVFVWRFPWRVAANSGVGEVRRPGCGLVERNVVANEAKAFRVVDPDGHRHRLSRPDDVLRRGRRAINVLALFAGTGSKAFRTATGGDGGARRARIRVAFSWRNSTRRAGPCRETAPASCRRKPRVDETDRLVALERRRALKRIDALRGDGLKLKQALKAVELPSNARPRLEEGARRGPGAEEPAPTLDEAGRAPPERRHGVLEQSLKSRVGSALFPAKAAQSTFVRCRL